MALNQQQRKWVREVRDHNKCQFPFKHQCINDFQVHHIRPQRIGGRDESENLITLCVNIHPGNWETVQNGYAIHPDIVTARYEYGVDRLAFAKVFAMRDVLVKHDKTYWNDKFDEQFRIIAYHNTVRAKEKGEYFPITNGKTKYIYDQSDEEVLVINLLHEFGEFILPVLRPDLVKVAQHILSLKPQL